MLVYLHSHQLHLGGSPAWMRVRVHPLLASNWAELTSLAQDYIELAGVEVGTRTSPQEGVEILALSNYIPTTNRFSSLNLRHIYCQRQSSVIKYGKMSVYQGIEKIGRMPVECWPRAWLPWRSTDEQSHAVICCQTQTLVFFPGRWLHSTLLYLHR